MTLVRQLRPCLFFPGAVHQVQEIVVQLVWLWVTLDRLQRVSFRGIFLFFSILLPQVSWPEPQNRLKCSGSK